MPKRKRMSAASRARYQKLYRQRVKSDHETELTGNNSNNGIIDLPLPHPYSESPSALIGWASPCGENILGHLEVGLSSRENASECSVVSAATPLGSRLSERTRFMSQNPESSKGDCTTSSTATVGVSSPKNGVAGQAQTGDEVPLEAYKGSPSISSYTKVAHSHCYRLSNEYLRNSEQTQTKAFQIKENFLQGNFHQGDTKFEGNRGQQCVPNCLVAAALNCKKTVNRWVRSDMDSILFTGNELYSHMKASSTVEHNYMLINELPRELDMFDSTFTFNFEESIATMIGGQCENVSWKEFNALPLFEALQMCLLQCHACFLCFNGNTILVGKRNGGFFIFDSHSRSKTGLVHENGQSICIFVNEIQAVYSHIQQLANSMGIFTSIECEVTGVNVQYNDNDEVNKKKSEDLYLVSVSTNQPDFIPFPENVQREVSKKLSIPFVETTRNVTKCQKANIPDVCHKVKGDGNCFFRAVSYAVSNTESNHSNIRQSVCDFAIENKDLLQGVLREEFESVKSYMEKSCMKQDGVWGY